MTAIKKLPPGEAIGADDLRNWAWRRNVGRSGTPMSHKEWKKGECRKRKIQPIAGWRNTTGRNLERTFLAAIKGRAARTGGSARLE